MIDVSRGELVGEGADTCAVGDLNGQVVMSFPTAVQWVSWDPQTASEIGEAMARSAYRIVTGAEKINGGSMINQQIRNRIVTRGAHIVRSLTEKGRLPGHIAAAVVDMVLSEVT